MSNYIIGDKKLASVTTIISDATDKSSALTQWAANMVVEWIKENCNQPSDTRFHVSPDELNLARFNFRDVSKKALDVGSKVHQAIEDWLNLGREPKNPEEQVLAAFVAFLEWADEHKLKCDAAEHTVTDNEKSAGTLDFVGDIDGEHTVIDFKSSKAIYIDYRYQIAAYRWMYNLDELRPDASRCGILRLDKETGYPEYKDTTKFYESDLRVYHKMVELFYARHPRLKKQAKIKEA